jgi:hypothetical protein
LEVAWLEDFLELDAKRSFSKGAEVRCVSQPAFSRRIQALEECFGTTLIERSTSSIALTPMGKIFDNLPIKNYAKRKRQNNIFDHSNLRLEVSFDLLWLIRWRQVFFRVYITAFLRDFPP